MIVPFAESVVVAALTLNHQAAVISVRNTTTTRRTTMTKSDLQREMQWALAKILFASDRIRRGGDLPSPPADAQVREWARANVGVMMTIDALTAAAMKLVNSYETGKGTCENCGQLMQRSYPLGLPEGAYVLACRGCGTNMNHVANPDMRYTEELYATKETPR